MSQYLAYIFKCDLPKLSFGRCAPKSTTQGVILTTLPLATFQSIPYVLTNTVGESRLFRIEWWYVIEFANIVSLTTSVLLYSAGAPCQVGGLGKPALGHPSLIFLPPIVLARVAPGWWPALRDVQGGIFARAPQPSRTRLRRSSRARPLGVFRPLHQFGEAAEISAQPWVMRREDCWGTHGRLILFNIELSLFRICYD